MRPPRLLLCLATCLLPLALGGGNCTGTDTPCSVCFAAVSLSVFDADDAPINDGWAVEATVDGLPVDTGACAPGVRVANTCSFGLDVGTYHLIVRGAGFQTREVAARVAAESGQDCNACLNPENVVVRLRPE